ncbi:MAG: hypothetical protein ACE5JG_07275, partial [Planctomycetota bacterium]
MPVFPVQIQPPELTGHYPHMSRHDTALWERFLTAFGREFEGFAYDVALGGRRPTLQRAKGIGHSVQEIALSLSSLLPP